MNLIQEITNTCQNIIETLQQSVSKANFENSLTQLQDWAKEFDFWFKTQINSEELLVNYTYTQLLKVREINKEIQFKQISEKSSQIKGISLDSHTSDGSQPEGCSVMTKFKQATKNIQKKGEALLELLNQTQEDQISQKSVQIPQRTYSLDKINYIITFEIQCLSQFDISAEQEKQLEQITKQPELRWIFELVSAKQTYKQTLQSLIKYAQEMLTYEFEDFNMAIEKMNNYLSTEESSMDLVSNKSFQMNQQLLVDKIKQSMADMNEKKKKLKLKMIQEQGAGDSKVCMCQIF